MYYLLSIWQKKGSPIKTDQKKSFNKSEAADIHRHFLLVPDEHVVKLFVQDDLQLISKDSLILMKSNSSSRFIQKTLSCR